MNICLGICMKKKQKTKKQNKTKKTLSMPLYEDRNVFQSLCQKITKS